MSETGDLLRARVTPSMLKIAKYVWLPIMPQAVKALAELLDAVEDCDAVLYHEQCPEEIIELLAAMQRFEKELRITEIDAGQHGLADAEKAAAKQ